MPLQKPPLIPKSSETADHPEMVRGMVLMTVAMLLIPGIDVFAKLLTSTMSAGQIVWFRFFVQTLLITPLILYYRLWRLTEGTLALQISRGILLAAATVFFFASLRYLSIAQAIAIFFVEPLILTLLSAMFLGEVIRIRRIMAIVIGFIGALVIIRPTFFDIGVPALYPLGTAMCFALYLMVTRKLTAKVHPLQMQWMVGISATISLSVMLMLGHQINWAVFDASLPQAIQVLWVILLGLIATVGHLLLVHAFKKAPASVLAPFQYVEIISATVFGYLVFGDGLDAPTIIGVSIIIASGLYLFHRENQLRQKTKESGS